ncbi:unnamed protein product [Strongylus vulgaris]|uniref:Uncharacterized protein n=1 Tax=Strongylus vulgaris TaxID=40348 RepID=A0A3P7J4K2_STRVU|nr:unnamed protein product [Strongylus vulgaris]
MELKEGIGKLIGGGGAYAVLVVVEAPVANIEGTTEGIPDGIEAENIYQLLTILLM